MTKPGSPEDNKAGTWSESDLVINESTLEAARKIPIFEYIERYLLVGHFEEARHFANRYLSTISEEDTLSTQAIFHKIIDHAIYTEAVQMASTGERSDLVVAEFLVREHASPERQDAIIKSLLISFNSHIEPHSL